MSIAPNVVSTLSHNTVATTPELSAGAKRAYWQKLLSKQTPTEIILRAQSFRVSPFYSALVFGFCVILAGNLLTIPIRVLMVNGLVPQGELPVFPIFCGILLLIVIPTTKERSRGSYFWMAWIFWLTYAIFGFAGAPNINVDHSLMIFRLMSKLWIAIIGMPWLAFRTISPERLPSLHKVITAMMTIGACFAIYQFFDSQTFDFIMVQEGRGAGFWENPNHCGIFLTMTLFLSFIPEWNRPSLAWGMRSIMLVAIIMTLSRAAYLGVFAGGIYYAFSSGKLGRFAGAIALSLVFAAGLFTFVYLIDQNVIPLENDNLRTRVTSILDFFRGTVNNDDLENSRLHLWSEATAQIQDESNLFIGSGHGSMERIKTTGHAPHNDILQILGEGGSLGLLAYLCFYGVLLRQAWQCKKPSIRGGLGAATIVLLSYSVTADKYLSFHTTSAFMVLFSMWGYYGRTIPSDENAVRFRNDIVRRANTSLT